MAAQAGVCPSSPSASQSQPWQASLALGFARSPLGTRLVERRHSGPLRVQKPLYPETPDVCHAIIVHPPGGIVGGDQLAVEVDVGERASAFITSPGAAKWYRANGRVSRQSLRLCVHEDAALEWMPQETIIYDAAQLELHTEIDLAAGASFIGCDILCFGRRASGERFASGSLNQQVQARREGKLIWFEQGRLRADSHDMDSMLVLGGHTVCATLLALGQQLPAGAIAAARNENDGLGAQFGITQMKHAVVARYLGNSSQDARRAMLGAWRHLRPALLGREAVTPRIWNT